MSEADFRFVATCMLFTAPNLLRGGRQHGIIENIATHPDYEGRGHGRAVIAAALDEAWRQDCHHVMLQSGRADPRVHKFSEFVRLQAQPASRLCRYAANDWGGH